MSRRAAAFEAQHALHLELMLCEEPAAPIAVKEALYRIGQEALQNTVKHAQATEVWVSLACRDGAIVLEVRDNGRGFDTTGSFPGHLGLQSMRERASQLGGTLEMESGVGVGTSIRVWMPVGVGAYSAR
jgi:signal transduction histidine kinase